MIQYFFTKFKDAFHEAVDKLKGSDKRLFLARTVEALGTGGQSFVAEEFNVSPDTLRLGSHELRTGILVVKTMAKVVHFGGSNQSACS